LERARQFIRETNDQARLEAFIRQFPDTPYAEMARARLAELKKTAIAVPAPDATSRSEMIPPRSSVNTTQFDGEWRVVYSYNAYWRTTSKQLVGRRRIADGVIVGLNGDRVEVG
jgi:hypothetical protein